MWYFLFGMKKDLMYDRIKKILECNGVNVMYFLIIKLKGWFLVRIVKIIVIF